MCSDSTLLSELQLGLLKRRSGAIPTILCHNVVQSPEGSTAFGFTKVFCSSLKSGPGSSENLWISAVSNYLNGIVDYNLTF